MFKYLCFDKWVCFSWERNKGAQVMGLGHLIILII